MRRGSALKLFSAASISLVCCLMAGCGGRVAKPADVSRSFDDQLSCDHLAAELRVNQYKANDLLGENRNANDNTAGLIAGAILVPPYLLFLDVSDTEKKEVEALARRNDELLRLGDLKGCEGFQKPGTVALAR